MAVKPFRIGTRNSPLALKQAQILRAALVQAIPDLEVEIVPIKSAADWKKSDGEKPLLSQSGGKGQFAKEIELMILQDEIDCGAHSLKDMASHLPEGLEINHVLPRADARDAFVSDQYQSIDALPEGAIVGTCSPRRQALCLAKRPDLQVDPFRGNVQTRLDKVKARQVDATYLAMAGLERLGIANEMIHALSVDDMMPACGQGTICMEIRSGDYRAQDVLSQVHCAETGFCSVAEREVLKILDGSCHTPIGAYADMKQDVLHLRAVVASLDGQQVFEEQISQSCSSNDEAAAIGQRVGNKLKEDVPERILS